MAKFAGKDIKITFDGKIVADTTAAQRVIFDAWWAETTQSGDAETAWIIWLQAYHAGIDTALDVCLTLYNELQYEGDNSAFGAANECWDRIARKR